MLLPVDGSEVGQAALSIALRFGTHIGTYPKIKLITVFSASSVSNLEKGETLLAPAAQKIKEASLVCETSVEFGEIPDAVNQASIGCDLVVLATHGRQGLDRMVKGSVAEEIIRRATIPVLAVRSGEPNRRDSRGLVAPVSPSGGASSSRSSKKHLFSSIMVPFDPTQPEMYKALLLRLKPVVERLDATVSLVAIVDSEKAGDKKLPEQLAAAQTTLDAIHQEVQTEGLNVSTFVVPTKSGASVSDTIVEEARTHDIAVMVTHARTGVTRLISGSVTENVLRTTQVPLLIFSAGSLGF
eukprot:TRINITY_DN12864_c0_g1_i1.p1 TRINITY_DN12864_c0_g1~~TRINITY_DN12864_c0_g1_i1.p1  ORF type:complete len:305 (-),score=80.03 TRINITY_DN12864_c0_g1_i1:61-954(-)